MKVYVVTSGDYSDYRIERIFSTMEKAKEYIDACCDYDVNDIEVYDLDEPVERELALYKGEVTLLDGNVHHVRREDLDEYHPLQDDEFQVSKYSQTIEFAVMTDSMDKAKRIIADRWMQVKAMRDIAFPHAFEKCTVNEYWTFGHKHVEQDYPIYNFVTKEIRLPEGYVLVGDLQKKKDNLEKMGVEFLL